MGDGNVPPGKIHRIVAEKAGDVVVLRARKTVPDGIEESLSIFSFREVAELNDEIVLHFLRSDCDRNSRKASLPTTRRPTATRRLAAGAREARSSASANAPASLGLVMV